MTGKHLLLAAVSVGALVIGAPEIGRAQVVNGPNCGNGVQCNSLGLNLQSATYTVGSTGDFATLNDAFAWINTQIFQGLSTIRLFLQDGIINEPANTSLRIQTDNGVAVYISGQHVYDHSVTSIQSSSGSAGARTYVLNLDSVSNVAVGDYETIFAATGGTNPTYITGVWPVTNVDSVNKRITITTTGLQAAAASGAVAATARDMKSIEKFTGADGIQVWGQATLNITDVIVAGDGSSHNGISLQDRNRVYVARNLAVTGFGGNNVMSIYNSEMNVDSGGVLASSGGGVGILATNGGGVIASTIIATGEVGDGILAVSGGGVEAQTLLTASGNGSFGAISFTGGSIIADVAANVTGNVGAGAEATSGGVFSAVTLNAFNNGGSGVNSGDRGILSIGTLNSSGNSSSDQVAFLSTPGFVTPGGCLAIGFAACQAAALTVTGNALFNGTSVDVKGGSSQSGFYVDTSGQAQIQFRDNNGSAKWELGHIGSSTYNFRLWNDTLSAAALTIEAATSNAAFAGPVKPGSVAVGGSNSCSVAGQRAWVTDASVAYSASTRGGQITGSGSNGVPAYCDGTHWDFL